MLVPPQAAHVPPSLDVGIQDKRPFFDTVGTSGSDGLGWPGWFFPGAACRADMVASGNPETEYYCCPCGS
jgi:hypothetical protein